MNNNLYNFLLSRKEEGIIILEYLIALKNQKISHFFGKTKSTLYFYKNEALLRDNNQIWDPISLGPNLQNLKENNKTISRWYDFYQTYPDQPKNNVYLLIFIVVFTLIVSLGQLIFIFHIGFVLGFFYYIFIRDIQKDLIKKKFSDKNKWLYNPKSDSIYGQSFLKKFPKLFPKNGRNPSIGDEFWGNTDNHKFYSAIISLTISHGKTQEHASFTVFAIPLHKKLQKSLFLESYFSTIFSKNSDINLESEEFNKKFLVEYDNNSDDKNHIFQLLSPAIQIKLIKLSKHHPTMRILFIDNTFIFTRRGSFLENKMRTNFFYKMDLDQKDLERLNQELKDILDIAIEIPKYLD